jgi:branched-subunit amino acid transport protein AzlD
MENEFLYMLAVVGAGWAVTYAMRALPFLLFAGRGRELPAWVTRFGSFISPVVIASLIVYSYSGLQWRTPWPYLAGALTVALHLWKGNPLVSISAGVALYMALVSCCGCASTHHDRELVYDAAHPLIHFTNKGMKFRDRYVTPEEAVRLLKKHKVPKDATIHMLVDEDFSSPRATWVFQHNYLGKAGYRKAIVVHARHASSSAPKRRDDRRNPPRR